MNILIRSLTSSLRQSILQVSEEVDLPFRSTLEEVGKRPEHVYFLNDGIASVRLETPERKTSEVAMIGREGFTGLTSLLGPTPPIGRCIMQIGGSGYKLPFASLRSLFHSSIELRDMVLRFTQQQFLSTSQIALCSKVHEIDRRLVRWLLMAHDRMQDSDINITHESLAHILGVHRPSVSISMGKLTEKGFIRTARRGYQIADRDALIPPGLRLLPGHPAITG